MPRQSLHSAHQMILNQIQPIAQGVSDSEPCVIGTYFAGLRTSLHSIILFSTVLTRLATIVHSGEG